MCVLLDHEYIYETREHEVLKSMGMNIIYAPLVGFIDVKTGLYVIIHSNVVTCAFLLMYMSMRELFELLIYT